MMKTFADPEKFYTLSFGDKMAGSAITLLMGMIARGALGNPWIFREALALWKGEKMPERPSIDEKKAMMKEQLAMLIDEKGERAGVR